MVSFTCTIVPFFTFILSTNLEVHGWSLVDRLQGRAPFCHRPLRRLSAQRGSFNTDSGSSTKKSQQDMVEFIDKPMESTVGDSQAAMLMDEDLLAFVKSIVRAADGRKAEDIVALKVGHVSTLASVLVILSGNSRPQNQAIAAAITRDVDEEYGVRPGGNGVPEGSAESGWILLDYGSVMVHIMTPKSRLFYNVEGQWKNKGGIYLDISDVLVPNKPEVPQQSQPGDFVAQEDDPFWS